MKQILIISEIFYPASRIGAVRMTKLAKYLHARGYGVTVFCSADNLTDSGVPELPFRVIYAGARSAAGAGGAAAKQGKSKRKRTRPLIYKLKGIYWQLLTLRRSRAFARLFSDAVRDGTLDLRTFDCVIASYGPLGAVLAAARAKQLVPELFLVQDFRDPMVTATVSKLLRPYFATQQRRAIRRADAVTTVTEGCARRMAFSGMPHPITVIPNGFDRDDRPEHTAEDGRFSFAYTGAMYGGRQDLSSLFSACARLIGRGELPREQVCFHYAGRDGAVFSAQAETYGLGDLVVDHGFVPRAESLRLQSAARFLMLSTWNVPGEEGVFTGKFLEYMLMEKPIVAVVSGTLANSEVTQVVRRFGLGVSCEEADPGGEAALDAWLSAQAEAYRAGKPAVFAPDRAGIAAHYDWEHLVERFCGLIDG